MPPLQVWHLSKGQLRKQNQKIEIPLLGPDNFNFQVLMLRLLQKLDEDYLPLPAGNLKYKSGTAWQRSIIKSIQPVAT